MDQEARQRTATLACGQLQTPIPPQVPKSRGRSMAQHGFRTSGEHACDPPSFPGESTMSDSEHTAVNDVQPTLLQPVTDRAPSNMQLRQLAPSDDTVLLICKRCDHQIH